MQSTFVCSACLYLDVFILSYFVTDYLTALHAAFTGLLALVTPQRQF